MTRGRNSITRSILNHGDITLSKSSHAYEEILDETFDEAIDFFEPIIVNEETQPASVAMDVLMPTTIPELL